MSQLIFTKVAHCECFQIIHEIWANAYETRESL